MNLLINKIINYKNQINCSGFTGSETAYFLNKLYKNLKSYIVVIVNSQKDTEKFMSDMNFFSGQNELPLIYFPSYSDIPAKFLFHKNEIIKKRISILYKLLEQALPYIIFTTTEALMQKIIPKNKLSDYAELIIVNEEINRDKLIEKLISCGYMRSMIVEEKGEFCVRGSILDIFSPQYDEPVRIEMFGDLVESIRFFSSSNQRTIQNIDEATILPANEAILEISNMDSFITRLRYQALSQEIPVEKTRTIIEQIKKGGISQGIESFIPLIYESLDTFFDYIPDNTFFVQIEPAELDNKAFEIEENLNKNYINASKEHRIFPMPEFSHLTWPYVKETLNKKKCLNIKALPISSNVNEESFEHHFSIQDNKTISSEIKNYHENPDYENYNLLSPLVDWIRSQKENKYLTVIVCSTKSQADRILSLLKPYGLSIVDADYFPNIERNKGLCFICIGQIFSGFVWQEESIAIITEDEIFGSKVHNKKKTKKSIKEHLLNLEELKKDDLVVHTEHGIGIYKGLVKLKLNGFTNDYLLLFYRDDDKLYLPVDRMSMIQKYVGVEEIIPTLDKMGGKSWGKAKDKAKQSVEKIAGELLNLYAARKLFEGHTYGEPDSYYRDFEAGFPYEETTDQMHAIEDVINDLKAPKPMDRLVCGDVGYGKTEVALRASFVVSNEGKQVAILVPTTILAEQHLLTFKSRFAKYPFNIGCLSRFRTKVQQRSIINDLKLGKTDIIIGTHRLLQKDISFKDLGLIIIDEEQRFGVKHKEQLKQLRTNVDVLSLTATPIPRTLHISLMGIRDISVISTPPEQRHPIITHIFEFDDEIIKDAIKKELKRDGQIYFVHNNVQNIWSIAHHIKELVPEVKLDVAHGQLEEKDLEKTMMKFINKEIDLLVCTTIIESGLDISTANTIIINRADKFGLAQIYQLRGRVGRSKEQAYAYLLVPNEEIITKDAEKRLKVLMEHSDLGSGFQIAMNDLRIRGGGAILGASQSGHIAALGYDMFLNLMENAMAELKGEVIQENLEPEINIPVSAFIPESYIQDIDQRLFTYRRLAKFNELKEISDIKEELIDRYGELPEQASNLLLKIMLKIMAVKAGIKKLDLIDNQLFLHISEIHQKNPYGIIDMIVSEPEKFELTKDNIIKSKLFPSSSLHGLIAQTKNLLKYIHQNCQ